MKKKSQKQPKKNAASLEESQIKAKSSFFPRIYRFITESWKLVVVSFISCFIIIGIVLQSLSLYHNLQQQEKIKAKKGSIEKELAFWKDQSEKYKDSRDIHFRLATLEYELGDTESAKTDLQKTLEIDPNFEKAREMEKVIK